MKKIIVIAVICLLTSCIAKMEKPFIIVDKDASTTQGCEDYRYQDKHGNEEWFKDSIGKYNVGDTLR